MIGESKAIKDIKEQINRIAPTDSKVLIRGESGSGKELVAWAIHYLSQRKNGPFVKMNCAAIPEELTESELFGYEKGAFTGAAETRDGKFLFADGGTLFLDEIADMSIAVQTKVLRVLQDGQFERVGGKETLSVDVRVIAATNKNLEEMVKQKFFREDLYYRLNVLPLYIPPLRERKTDIPLLVTHFMEKYCFKNNHKQVLIDKEVMNILKDYPWPGNIRELQNLMERLIIMSSGDTIKLQDLPPHILKKESEVADIQPGTKSLKEVRESAEREYIRTCLNYCNENVSETADLLKIERTNLHKKMRALGIRKGK
jgi:two-component system nitrogen regulation response regulator NtrX